jgi:FkbM family methyltransferase
MFFLVKKYLYKFSFWYNKIVKLIYYNVRYRLYPWKDIEGILFPVNINYGYSVIRFIDNGTYEGGEIAIIKETVGPEDIVLELGTGLGFISAFCSKRIGSDRVYTFEANPQLEENIKKLYRRNHVNPNLEFAVLGNNNGEKIFYVDKNNLLASSLKEIAGKNIRPRVIQQKNINVVMKNINPTFLIMDIEGGEYDIFMTIEFGTINRIQFELHPLLLNETQMDEIFEVLSKNKFVENSLLGNGNNFFFEKIKQ